AVLGQQLGQPLGRVVVDRAVVLEGRQHRGQQPSDLLGVLLAHRSTPISIARSATWTAFRAAPLRRLSLTIQSAIPFRAEGSGRIRPTKTSSCPATSAGVG